MNWGISRRIYVNNTALNFLLENPLRQKNDTTCCKKQPNCTYPNVQIRHRVSWLFGPCCIIAFVVLEPWSGVDGKIMLAIASIIGRSPAGSVLGGKIGFRNLSVVNDWRYFTWGIENLSIIFCADPFIIGFALIDSIDLAITSASSPKKICCIV